MIMEIFNPTEWARIHKIQVDDAQTEVNSIRKRENISFTLFDQTITQNQSKKPITLSSNELTKLLGGGFIPGDIYLFYGEYATGKTQVCLHACVSLYDMYKDMELPISALYIDTENTFRPERIQEIASEGYNLNNTKVFSRIRVVKASSTEGIYTLLKKIDSIGLDKEVKLIIIDSLTNFIRVDLGNEDISNIQVRDKLKRILVYLREITKKYNIVTILNSQVTGFIAENSIFTCRPIMEFVLNHYVDEIVYLHREGDLRWADLVNSKWLASRKVSFTISTSGITD
jgi:DNA repair protein RadA